MNAGDGSLRPAVCVVGLGKIGLPLAVQIAGKGRRVVGADINLAVVNLVNSGMPPFPGEDGLDDRLSVVIDNGMLQACTETSEAVSESDVVIVVVPLVIDDDHQGDFSALDAATACGAVTTLLNAIEIKPMPTRATAPAMPTFFMVLLLFK